MQKVITVRCSQKGLTNELAPYISKGWRVVSTTRGSEWTRILFTYKWTVVLEKVEAPKTSLSTADELVKAKQLFDSGAIDKEEYERLKKKILG